MLAGAFRFTVARFRGLELRCFGGLFDVLAGAFRITVAQFRGLEWRCFGGGFLRLS